KHIKTYHIIEEYGEVKVFIPRVEPKATRKVWCGLPDDRTVIVSDDIGIGVIGIYRCQLFKLRITRTGVSRKIPGIGNTILEHPRSGGGIEGRKIIHRIHTVINETKDQAFGPTYVSTVIVGIEQL